MLAGHEVPFYKVLQHASTLAGGLLVLYSVFQLVPETQLPKKDISLTYWLSVIAITLTVVAFRLWVTQSQTFIGNIIVTVIAGGFIGLILTPVILRMTSNLR